MMVVEAPSLRIGDGPALALELRKHLLFCFAASVRFRFHSVDGTMPSISFGRSTPVRLSYSNISTISIKPSIFIFKAKR